VPEFLVQWLDRNKWTLIGILSGFVFLVALLFWLAFGSGPRRKREMRRLRKITQDGKWKEALEGIRALRTLGRPSASTRKELDSMEADCLRKAASEAMKAKQYEASLEHLLRVIALVGGSEVEVRAKVQNAILDEARKQFALSGASSTKPVQELLARALKVQAPCREAIFWIGMCQLRDNQPELAIVSLQEARTGQAISITEERVDPAGTPPSPVLDPAFYIGAVLLRQNRPKDALRFLTEANRLDPNCPLVPLHLGAAMIAAGGDASLALRAIQRAIGPRGMGQWSDKVSKFWAEVFPGDGKSYVRRLAEKHPYACPLYGSDMAGLLRLAFQAQAQAYFRQGEYRQAADWYEKLLKESAPTPEMLRALGISLAKLGKYDEAFPHLKMAYEQEITKDRDTTGWFALSAALGSAPSDEDRQLNLRWAVQMVSGINAPRNAEWVGLISKIFAAARKAGVGLSLDEQLYLCEHLTSVDAIDANAAEAYAYLMETHPTAVTHEYAWLFARAAQDHPVEGPASVALMAMAFADAENSRTFFAQRKWDFDALERVFLERAANGDPGKFPAVLGSDYAPRGIRLLLDHSAEREKAGDKEGALRSAQTLLQLDPHNTQAMDRVACLQHRLGQDDASAATLARWAETQPQDPLPIVRQALIRHGQKRTEDAMQLLHASLERCSGRRRAEIAFLAGKLTLQAAAESPESNGPALSAAQGFLEDGLRTIPDHRDGLAQLAAIHASRSATAGLAALAPAMKSLEGPPRFRYFAALAAHAAQDRDAVIEIVGKLKSDIESSRDPEAAVLMAEAAFIAGLASHERGDRPAALAYFEQAAQAKSDLATLARAWAGRVAFEERRHDEAAQSWQKIDAAKRTEWKLVEPLAGATFLAALDDYHAHRFEIASEKLRQSGKLGWRDRRLGPLLFLSLFEGGKQAIYGNGKPRAAPTSEDRP
jgi:tetratricopeptide (TPR) repeat protein